MHKEHKKILSELKKYKRKDSKYFGSSYIGSSHTFYNVAVPVRRQITKDWLRGNKSLNNKEIIKVVDSLYKGKSHEEKTVASMILGYKKEIRKEVKVKDLDKWLNHLVGWAEIDNLCQNVFEFDELLGNWKEWSDFIKKLSKDKNINKRRASLVFLTGPTHYSNDQRLKKLAFETIDKLKAEKDILITKAISWLLRDMSEQHKKDVSEYLDKNEDSLPKIALRETRRKIKTGKK